MKLTDKERQIVADNHKLIFWYMNKYLSNNIDESEYYDLLAIELCHTVQKYDKSKGSLANYYKLRANGIICKEFRKTQAIKRTHIKVSLLDNVHVTEDESLTQLETYEWMDGEHNEILTLKADGYSQTEIGEMLGVSQSFVSKVIKKVKEKYMESEENYIDR